MFNIYNLQQSGIPNAFWYNCLWGQPMAIWHSISISKPFPIIHFQWRQLVNQRLAEPSQRWSRTILLSDHSIRSLSWLFCLHNTAATVHTFAADSCLLTAQPHVQHCLLRLKGHGLVWSFSSRMNWIRWEVLKKALWNVLAKSLRSVWVHFMICPKPKKNSPHVRMSSI